MISLFFIHHSVNFKDVAHLLMWFSWSWKMMPASNIMWTLSRSYVAFLPLFLKLFISSKWRVFVWLLKQVLCLLCCFDSAITKTNTFHEVMPVWSTTGPPSCIINNRPTSPGSSSLYIGLTLESISLPLVARIKNSHIKMENFM